MMRRTVFFSLVFFLLQAFHTLKAQQQGTAPRQLDSLTRLMQSHPPPEVQMKVFIGLSDYWRSRDNNKAMAYARQMSDIARSRQDKLYIGIAAFVEGNVYNSADQLDSALNRYRQALKILEPLKEKTAVYYQARVWNNKGIILQKKDSAGQYLDILLNTVVPLAEKIKDSAMIGHAYVNIISLMVYSGRYEKALSYYDAIIGLYKKFLPDEMLAIAYLAYVRGTLFSGIPDLNFAGKNLALARARLAKDTSSRVWINYYGMAGGLAFTANQYTRALQCFDSGLALNARWKVGYDALTLVWGKAETYYKMNRVQEAKRAMYELDKFVSIYNMKADRIALLRKIAFLEAATGNYPLAYRKLDEYVQRMDTANLLKANVAIADLEEKYQNAQKQHEIELLQSKSRFNRYLTLSSIALTLLLVLLLLLLRSRYRARKAAAEQEATLLLQKIQQQQQEQQYEVARALLEGEERERRRLAGDLHDGLGGMLATARMNLTGLTDGAGDTQRGLDKVIGQLDQSVNELRRIARNMIPEALLRSGLETALTDLCASLPADKINVDYQMIGIPDTTPGQQELVIYRIVQELLTNVLRHAGATEIFVQCSQRDHTFHITVEDNGKGLDDVADGNNKGIGIANVRNRVAFLRGRMDIRSAPGKGTAIDIELHLT